MECCPECESSNCRCDKPGAIVAQWKSKIVGDSEFACIDDWNEMPIAMIGRRVEITVRLVEEHQAILSEEQRLNAMGQERELALMAKVADLEKRLLVAKEALKFYSRTGGASDTNDRKGCWILARRFIFGEAIAHDFEKIPYGETGTEYLLAGKRAREAIAAIEKEGE